ncbi:MAG: ribosome maturation factor RimP [Oscillospiraceae bacterium]|jgi:ribosome maturation factor RimP|nr:ribosome maturation factor RimP [Oscillospiraceae bacterium]
MDIAARAKQLAQPHAEQLGLTLWDVRFLKEGAHWYLRFWIDKPGGIGLDDCEALSRAIDKPLDDANFIQQQYSLEVCSPGIERELTRDEHFAQFIGSKLRIKITHPARELVGELTGYADKQLTIALDDGASEILTRKQCAWVKLYDDFDNMEKE